MTSQAIEWLAMNATGLCPCDSTHHDEEDDYVSSVHRLLAEAKKDDDLVPWEVAVVVITITIMFALMITDKVYADWVMLGGLLIFMVTQIISLKEGLAGFANEGILTVLALFVVADGLSRTGALDYYMGKILGRPTTIAGAQIRLTIPIAIISAFFNNTPVVALMIPVVLRWSKMIGCPKQQLLMPLSYATILGGTCTLVGTSTNLVVSGLLEDKYKIAVGFFEVGKYGVPNAIIGISYMLICGTFFLPFGRNTAKGGEAQLATGDYDDLLVGARVLSWSPAAGRTVKRSGLNNSAGIYLVNVRRAATGNLHRAVSNDFVVSVGDELYFSGSVEEFSAFCQTHGLEIITASDSRGFKAVRHGDAATLQQKKEGPTDSTEERLKLLHRISDQIEGTIPVEPGPRPTRVIVTRDAFHSDRVILVAVDCADRPGLLSDISDALFKQASLQIKHSEANVVEGRSLSVWRCETLPTASTTDETETLDKVWNVVSQVLPDVAGTDSYTGATANSVPRTSGVQVVRAIVTKSSALIGKKPLEVDFTRSYKAAVVAYQKGNGKNATLDVPLEPGDLLVLATNEDSALLEKPPKGFYSKSKKNTDKIENDIELDSATKEIWMNLKVLFVSEQGAESAPGEPEVTKGEFLTAFTIPSKSPFIGKTMHQLGYAKLPGIVLVSCERPTPVSSKVSDNGSLTDGKSGGKGVHFTEFSPDETTLQMGDVLWFSGSAESMADLQRINGLAFYQETGGSIIQERRLVQAVVARASPLVGHTVADVQFRTVYGGAVLAIQRGSERVHEHPGVVKLHTGDVLLVEADRSFVKKHSRNNKVFALVSEVEDSSPPRPQMFFISLIMIFTVFAVSAVESLDQSLFVLSALVGIVMACLGVLTQQEARDAIQWDLYIVVASAFGVSTAMTNSGVAKGLATFLVNVGDALKIGGK
jgi:di/tricarboxylate transporter